MCIWLFYVFRIILFGYTILPEVFFRYYSWSLCYDRGLNISDTRS